MNASATTYLQGIEVPTESIDPKAFFALTRRLTVPEKTNMAYAGLGNTDTIQFLKNGIVAEVVVRFTGTLTLTVGTGTIASTANWPYNLLQTAKFTANGQSNLINASGLSLKARELATNTRLSDRGVSQTVGGATVSQGTFASASEKWGVGSSSSGLAGAPTNYTVDLEWVIPVAENQQTLAGAIFLATTSTDVTLELSWAQLASLFTLTGNATATLSGTITVTPKRFTIPVNNGQIIVPDLSLFHSMIENTVALAGESRLAGQGVGKSCIRIGWQVWNGAAPQAPLPVTDSNFAEVYWRYGQNETPEDIQSGTVLRQLNENTYGVDMGGTWGYGFWEFGDAGNGSWGFRDAVDEGTTADLRIGTVLASGVSQSSPQVRYFSETIFSSLQGA